MKSQFHDTESIPTQEDFEAAQKLPAYQAASDAGRYRLAQACSVVRQERTTKQRSTGNG